MRHFKLVPATLLALLLGSLEAPVAETVAASRPMVLPTPADLTVPVTNMKGSYRVSWKGVPNAASYQLQERAGWGVWKTVHRGTALTQMMSGRAKGIYGYRVRACPVKGRCSWWASPVNTEVMLPRQQLITVTDTSDGYIVSFSAPDPEYTYGLKENVKGLSWKYELGSQTAKTFVGRSPGTYVYEVDYCLSYLVDYGDIYAQCFSAYDTWGWAHAVKEVSGPNIVLPPPAGLAVPSTNTTSSYEVSWIEVAGATGYELQEREGEAGTWLTIVAPDTPKHVTNIVAFEGSQQTTKVSDRLTEAMLGKTNGTYQYRVRACSYEGACVAWAERIEGRYPVLTCPANAEVSCGDWSPMVSVEVSVGEAIGDLD